MNMEEKRNSISNNTVHSKNVLLLRVGADVNYGGFHSPIFEDKSFRFIPIPDCNVLKEHRISYQDYKWADENIANYLPDMIKRKGSKQIGDRQKNYYPWFVHDDPEFRTYTYGSPIKTYKGKIEKNYRGLCKLDKDYLLIFYADFSAHDPNLRVQLDGFYMFAYFIIERPAIEYQNQDDLPGNLKKRIAENHHVLHGWHNQVVALGDMTRSRVFKKAVLLSLKSRDLKGQNYFPCQEIQDKFHYKKSLNLSSLRTLDDSVSLESVKNLLDRASS